MVFLVEKIYLGNVLLHQGMFSQRIPASKSPPAKKRAHRALSQPSMARPADELRRSPIKFNPIVDRTIPHRISICL